MESPDREALEDLTDEINSRLAALRNSLYLASRRSQDVELLRYLVLADEEVGLISGRLRDMMSEVESHRRVRRWAAG